MNPSIVLKAWLQAAPGLDRVTPRVRPCDGETPLLRFWQRCRNAGLRKHERINFELVLRSMLAELNHATTICRRLGALV